MQVSAVRAISTDEIVMSKSNELTANLRSLEVGQGFEVSGVTRQYISGRVSYYGARLNRKFGTRETSPGTILIFRKL